MKLRLPAILQNKTSQLLDGICFQQLPAHHLNKQENKKICFQQFSSAIVKNLKVKLGIQMEILPQLLGTSDRKT